MSKPPYSSYNPYFLIPFIIWIIVGGILLAFFDKQVLFAAVNMHHSPAGDVLMYNISHMGEGGFVIIVLLVLMGAYVYRSRWYVLTAFLCNLLPAAIIQLLKHVFKAPRPLNYFHEAGWVHIATGWPRLYHNSFPSGHSAGAFSLFCFLAFLLPARYRAFGLLFFLLALSVCYSRLYLAAHFFADVYAGSVIGTLITIAGFALMRYLQPRFYSNKNLQTNN